MSNKPDYIDRVQKLRALMAKQGVQGFIVPRADEWQGEFVAEYAERLRWLTGFTGSGGAAVVLEGAAMLLTDSRYTLQAAAEVDTDIFEVVNVVETPMAKWLAEHCGEKTVVAYDARLHTPDQLEKLRAEGLTLRAVDNLIDALWDDQPTPPQSEVRLFPEHIAGRSAQEKCTAVGEALRSEGLERFIVTLPDSLAWLLNIRGQDTAYIPVALSYLIIDQSGAVTWFVDPVRVPENVQAHLGPQVNIVKPSEMEATLSNLPKGEKIGIDPKHSAEWFDIVLKKAGAEICPLKDPCIMPKSLKTPQEQKAIRQAHVTDAVALVKFLAWIDCAHSLEDITEMSAAARLREFRAQSDEFLGSSFPTISGFGANGAIVHYRAKPHTDTKVTGDSLLLVDSGAQYQGGTTDITRTILIGAPSDEMKEIFTRVLMGHIDVARAEFAKGTLGKDIDALARAPLKEVGQDFAHGTGHGVGCYLAVHEEAANLSPRGEAALQVGMLISNEPGYYKEGEYGIRIENLVLVEPRGDKLGFETVSFAPIDQRLIVTDMLSSAQRTWLNEYHAQVLGKISKYLDGDDKAWLSRATQAL